MRLRLKHTSSAKKVLDTLSKAKDFRLVEDLAEVTQLGPVVYPVLAEIHKHGLVEPQWIDNPGGPKLGYHITLKGHEYLKAPPENTYPWRLEPLMAKLRSWLPIAPTDESKK
jgi:hypothetical protein